MRSLLVLIGTYTILIALMSQDTFAYAVSRLFSRHQTTLIFAAHSSVISSGSKASSGWIKQQAAKAWRTGDADAFAKLLASNGLFLVPGNRWVGTTKIRQVFAKFAASHSVKIEIKQILIEGDRC